MPNQLKKFEFKEPKTLSPVTKTTTGVVDELESKSIKDTLADKLKQQKDQAALTIQRVFRGMQARTEAFEKRKEIVKNKFETLGQNAQKNLERTIEYTNERLDELGITDLVENGIINPLEDQLKGFIDNGDIAINKDTGHIELNQTPRPIELEAALMETIDDAEKRIIDLDRKASKIQSNIRKYIAKKNAPQTTDSAPDQHTADKPLSATAIKLDFEVFLRESIFKCSE